MPLDLNRIIRLAESRKPLTREHEVRFMPNRHIGIKFDGEHPVAVFTDVPGRPLSILIGTGTKNMAKLQRRNIMPRSPARYLIIDREELDSYSRFSKSTVFWPKGHLSEHLFRRYEITDNFAKYESIRKRIVKLREGNKHEQ